MQRNADALNDRAAPTPLPRAWPVFRRAATAVSPGGNRGRLLILIYHQVLDGPDPLRPGTVTRDDFAWQMATLAACFNVLPLAEAARRLEEGTLPPRAVAITFDDGYRDNVDNALPLLQANGLTATFFITTGTLGRYMWNDAVIESVRRAPGSGLDTGPLGLGVLPVDDEAARVATLYRMLRALKTWPRERRDAAVAALLESTGTPAPEGLMMDTGHVRMLSAAGMGIGAHTVTHPILTRIDREQARDEITEGRDSLEAITGDRIPLFAYPNGRPGDDYTASHVELVRELGFSAAVSTAWGANRRGVDRFQLRRLSLWDRTPERFATRLLLACMQRP